MPTAVRQPEPVTVEAFDTFVAAQVALNAYELVDNVIYLIPNPPIAHEQIAANIAALLMGATDNRQCQNIIGGKRVQRSDNPRDGNNMRRPARTCRDNRPYPDLKQ